MTDPGLSEADDPIRGVKDLEESGRGVPDLGCNEANEPILGVADLVDCGLGVVFGLDG